MKEKIIKAIAATAVAAVASSALMFSVGAAGENASVKASADTLKVKNVANGVKIMWPVVKGAKEYKVYRVEGGKQKVVTETELTEFIHRDVKSGKKYTYTVKAFDKKGEAVGKSNQKGKSVLFVKGPATTTAEITAKGVTLNWTKVKGAVSYSVFAQGSDKKWKKVASVKGLSFTHKNLKSGSLYKYKVRAVGKDGKFVSGFGKAVKGTFTTAPKIASVTSVDGANIISWKEVKNCPAYRVLRKELGSSWSVIADVSRATSYTDATAEKGKVYAYTLRCISDEGKAISGYIDDTLYYVDGALAQGNITVNGKTYRFNNGSYRNGLQTIDGKLYYYNANGDIQKNAIVGSAEEGYYYADEKGVINRNYVDGIDYKGDKWVVINGEAKKAVSKSDITLYRAAKEVAKATTTDMTKEEKLLACFKYAQKTYPELRPRTPHYTEIDWPILYANDMFVGKGGNCFSYGAAFAYMARAIGYEEVYCCNSGGHGWAEIDGEVYDPEWGKHYKNYTYFGLDYDEIKNPNYKGAISAMKPWMHVKVVF